MASEVQVFRVKVDLKRLGYQESSTAPEEASGYVQMVPDYLFAGDSFQLVLECYEDHAAGTYADYGAAGNTAKLYLCRKDVEDSPVELATGVISQPAGESEYAVVTFDVVAGAIAESYGNGDTLLLYARITGTDLQTTIAQQLVLNRPAGTGAESASASGMAYTPADSTDWSWAAAVPSLVSTALDYLADMVKTLVGYGAWKEFENDDVDTGTETVVAVTAADGDAFVLHYRAKSGTAVRCGQIHMCLSSAGAYYGSPVTKLTDDPTAVIGNADTDVLEFSADVSGSSLRCRATVTSDDWDIEGKILKITDGNVDITEGAA